MAHVINWFDKIDSTNNEAFRQVETAPDMSVFAAKFQTNGRGQKGNSWESAAGKNLTFSILLKPTFIPVEKQFLISQMVALGILGYLSKNGIAAKIKWPNDIYVENNKICGILIEHHICGANLSASIIGIGLNVNQKVFNSDAPNPYSMYIADGLERTLEVELESLVCHIFELYSKLKSAPGYAPEMEQSYHENLYRRNEFHEYELVNEQRRIKAKIIGVNQYACLLLETEDGAVNNYAFKEIKYIL